MANTIELAARFAAILDELYKARSVTAFLDSQTLDGGFANVNTVNVLQMTLVGMGNYSRSNGYPKGRILAEWVPMTLTQDRGREFNIDRMDNEETMGIPFARLADEYYRLFVAPEVDAYRFAVWAGWDGVQTVDTPATLDNETLLEAIDEGNAALDDQEVPEDGRVLFVSSKLRNSLKTSVGIPRGYGGESTINRAVENLDGQMLRWVPQGRFNTEITLDPGATEDAGGYTATGSPINFMLLHPSAVITATKLDQVKVFMADVNQDMDAHKIQHRLYHDTWLYDNKSMAVYVHAGPEPAP